MTRGSLQVAAAVLLSNAVCLRKSLSWLLIYPRRVLAKKHLLATFADRPTLGCWKKEAGGRGRLSETGFDSLVLVRVGLFVAKVSFDVCVVAEFECCSKRLSLFQWPTWISVFQLFGSGRSMVWCVLQRFAQVLCVSPDFRLAFCMFCWVSSFCCLGNMSRMAQPFLVSLHLPFHFVFVHLKIAFK